MEIACDSLPAILQAQEACDFSSVLGNRVLTDGMVFSREQIASFWSQDGCKKVTLSSAESFPPIGCQAVYEGDDFFGYFSWAVDRNGRIIWYKRTERPIPAFWPMAIAGQAADSATTMIGISAGLSEGNPLISPPMLALKLLLPSMVESADYDFCVGAKTGLGVFGFSAAAANVILLAGGPAAAAGMAAMSVTLAAWDSSREDAEYGCLPGALEVLRLAEED